jgi:hypothetical protein
MRRETWEMSREKIKDAENINRRETWEMSRENNRHTLRV